MTLKHRATAVLILLALEASAVWGILLCSPPAVTPAEAPADVFSAERAMRHVRELAREPHPVGSFDHARVRNYILASLLDLGLHPDTSSPQKTFGFGPGGGSVELINVLCRIEGSDSSGAVMLAAHYDSVPAGPGAGDDAAAVAALLETLRALKTRVPLRNDLILLITDGEEQGLRGAHGFVEEHPWAKDVRLVLNFEARGNSGASMMFETSDGNGRLIQGMASTVESPVSSSLAYTVYKMLPNDTDFTEFKRAGMQGLNFAFIDGAAAYHTPLDSYENVSPRSVQHHGEQALALTRHFGNMNLDLLGDADRTGENRPGNRIFFHAPFGVLVHYSTFFARWSAALILTLVVVTLVVGWRRGVLTVKSVGAGALGTLSWLRYAAGATLVLWFSHTALQTMGLLDSLVPHGERLRSPLIVLGIWNVLLALGPLAAPWRKSGERLAAPIAGSLVLWSAILVASLVHAPGASYIVAWPLLLATIPLAFLVTRGPEEWQSPRSACICLMTGLPITFLFVGHQYLFFLAAAPNPLIAIFTSLVVAALGATLLLPQLKLSEAMGRRTFTALTGAIAALCFAGTISL